MNIFSSFFCLFFLTSLSFSNLVDINSPDRRALFDLFTLNLNDYSGYENLALSDHCSWEGVTCENVNGFDRVVKIEIFEKVSFFPESFGNLDQLRELVMVDNEFFSSLPNSFSKLKNLKKLDLSHSIIQFIPLNFMNDHPFLESFKCRNCYALTSIPRNFSFPNLEELDLYKCDKVLLRQANIINLPKIKSFSLTQTSVPNEFLRAIFSSPVLEELVLGESNIPSLNFSEYFFSSLKVLDFSETNITSFSSFRGTNNLLIFRCYKCPLKELPNFLDSTSNEFAPFIEEIDLKETYFQNFDSTPFKNLKIMKISARNIKIDQNSSIIKYIELENASCIFKVPFSVEELYLTSCSLNSWNQLFDLENGTKINTFVANNVSYCSEHTSVEEPLQFPSFLLQNTSLFPNLTQLSLSMSDINGELPEIYPQAWIPLESLKIDRLKLRGTIPSSFGRLHNLKVLQIMDQNLVGTIPKEFKNLTNLWDFEIFSQNMESIFPLENLFANRLLKCIIWKTSTHFEDSLQFTYYWWMIDPKNNEFTCYPPILKEPVCLMECTSEFTILGWWVQRTGTIKGPLWTYKSSQTKFSQTEDDFFGFSYENIVELTITFENIPRPLYFRRKGTFYFQDIKVLDENTYQMNMNFNQSSIEFLVPDQTLRIAKQSLCSSISSNKWYPVTECLERNPQGFDFIFGNWLNLNCTTFYQNIWFNLRNGTMFYGGNDLFDFETCNDESNRPVELRYDHIMLQGFDCYENKTFECTPICGNGLIHDPETCDDGNLKDGDGCESTCNITQEWACNSDTNNHPNTYECLYNCGDKYMPSVRDCVSSSSSEQTNNNLEIVFPLLFVFLVVIFICCYIFYFTQKRNQNRMTIKEEEIEPLEVLGEGQFGKVFRGKWRNTTDVAIKVLKDQTDDLHEIELFKKEALLLVNLRPHPNIVQFLGICGFEKNSSLKSSFTFTRESSSKKKISNSQGQIALEKERTIAKFQQCQGLMKIVTEYLSFGNLISFMKNRFPYSIYRTENWPENLSEGIVYELAQGIAAGMDHLHQNNIVHRDLAARNVLMQTTMVPGGFEADEMKLIPKISDFGLSTKQKGAVKIPVRWSAPEVLSDHTKSSFHSDVWSFGIVLFEILVACQNIPYHKLTKNKEVIEFVLGEGGSQEPPSYSPLVYSSVMRSCLAHVPEVRPTFRLIHLSLMSELEKIKKATSQSISNNPIPESKSFLKLDPCLEINFVDEYANMDYETQHKVLEYEQQAAETQYTNV